MYILNIFFTSFLFFVNFFKYFCSLAVQPKYVIMFVKLSTFIFTKNLYNFYFLPDYRSLINNTTFSITFSYNLKNGKSTMRVVFKKIILFKNSLSMNRSNNKTSIKNFVATKT